jgi:hypothetical protein
MIKNYTFDIWIFNAWVLDDIIIWPEKSTVVESRNWQMTVFFMGKEAVLDCISSLKVKNCEGCDRRPQRISKDSIDHLLNPLNALFQINLLLKKIPDQWKIAKVQFTERVQKLKFQIIGHFNFSWRVPKTSKIRFKSLKNSHQHKF